MIAIDAGADFSYNKTGSKHWTLHKFTCDMPELPEVETVARGLRASLVGRTIVDVEVHWVRSITAPEPAAFAQRLKGQTVADVGRRGKWIAIALNDGDTLLVHLRMTGQLLLDSGDRSDDQYARVLFLLDDGRRLRFSDTRKFGRIVLTADPDEVLGELGPEPLADDFTAVRLGELLAGRRGRIKPLLLDQRFLAGLGNIYASEALWRASVHPLRRADSLSPAEVQRLHEALRSVLRAAIAEGGTTLADAAYQQTNGQPGEFARKLAVYGREGEPCPRCGMEIERIKVGQRSTYLCPHCQPPPKAR
jgi:formamidopyrimidine-DNA glycosylase